MRHAKRQLRNVLRAMVGDLEDAITAAESEDWNSVTDTLHDVGDDAAKAMDLISEAAEATVPAKDTPLTIGDVENAVALMDSLTAYREAPVFTDEDFQASFSGRKGLYQLLIELGIALDRVVGEKWEEYDWYVTVDAIATRLAAVHDVTDLPGTDAQLDTFVTACLRTI